MELRNEIEKSFSTCITVLSSFENDQLNVVPAEGSWTAGQVTEHILKSAGNLPEFFSHAIEPTSRAINEKEEEIKKLFLDFSIKMQSPEFIRPSVSIQYRKKELLEDLERLKTQALDAAETQDLSYTCKSFEFPGWGFLTKWEWLVFMVCHVKRHTHQLENIKNELSLQR
jgi:hypothetical protein